MSFRLGRDKKRGYFLNLMKTRNNKNPNNRNPEQKSRLVRNQTNTPIQQSCNQSVENVADNNNSDALKNIQDIIRLEIKKSISNARGSIIEEVRKEVNSSLKKITDGTNGTDINKLPHNARTEMIENTIKNIEQDLSGESIVIFILHPEENNNNTSTSDKLPNLVVVCDVGEDLPKPSSIESSIVIVPNEI